MILLSPICISACLQALPSLDIRDFLDWESKLVSQQLFAERFCLPKPLPSVPDSSLQVCKCDICELPFCHYADSPCVSFILPRLPHRSLLRCLCPSFLFCLVSNAPHSILPFSLFFLHLFARSSSTPSSLPWSDHMANLIKLSFSRLICIFSGVLSCMCVNKVYLSQRDLSVREFHLPELMFKQTDSRQQWCCILRGNDIFAM